MADAHKNFAKGTLTNAPGTAGTSFVLSSGEGALFAANMPVTIAPANVQPTKANAEIGYITAVATDTLTVTRTQEGSTNQNVQTGWQVIGSITAKALTDIEANVTTLQSSSHTHANKALLDTYTQTESNLADAVTKKHAHSNQTVLDNTTASYTTAEQTKLSGIATGATANSSDATLLARANHTGTQSADTLTDGTTNKAFLATERTKLSGIATGATANDTDANLKARANHTGTQTASTISDFSTAADARISNAIGTTVQAYDADLTTWGGKTAPSGAVVGTTDIQTLSSKTLQAPSVDVALVMNGSTSGSVTITAPAVAGIASLSLPSGSDTLVGRASTDTLTNKTLTSPVLGGTVTGTYTLGGTPTFPSDVVRTTSSSNTLPTGSVVQSVTTSFQAYASGTATIPLDDTIPQITEGTEFMTASITPKSATNKLVVDVRFYGAFSANAIDVIVALFRDSTANALAVASETSSGVNYRAALSFNSGEITAGSTTATTFRVRAGGAAAGTTMMNGAGSRYFGALNKSSITITEYKA